LKGGFDGTTIEKPASNWGNTGLTPCLGVNFKRLTGAFSHCVDDKDHERFGQNVPRNTIKWCSDDWDKDENKNIYMKTMFEQNDTIIIPATWKVHFNCKEPVRVKVLEIYGELIFEEGGDRHLTATHIFVSFLGALKIGTAEKPFANKATIALSGHRRTPAWPVGSFMSKFIISSGILDLYGKQLPTWTRLAKGVEAGSTDLHLDKDLLLQKGDKLLVTTTSPNANQFEERTVASVKGTKVTLSEALTHAHDGLDTAQDGVVETIGMMSAEVAVVRGASSLKVSTPPATKTYLRSKTRSLESP